MPFCGNVTGRYTTANNFHELVLLQEEDTRRLGGVYRNASASTYLGLYGAMGHPDYDSRMLTVTHSGRESSLTLTGRSSTLATFLLTRATGARLRLLLPLDPFSIISPSLNGKATEYFSNV